MVETSAANATAEGVSGWIAGLSAYYADAQLTILAITFLFMVSAIFVLNRAVDEISKARAAREQAESVFTRLNSLLTGIENGETPFNESARSQTRRISMSGPARRSVTPNDAAAVGSINRKKEAVKSGR